ncbi:MAG: BCD family MFS transporter [Chloroflexi bacterium]|nr:BCD family MFS transporter [Chloroflexota bacterium]
MANQTDANLSVGHNLKIALFHLGSGMADVLTTGVWNRIMVADLGFSAAFVGLLTGLRYFLAPIGVIAGRYSDTHTIGGYRRLFWIWLGRAMMAISTLMLGFATAELVRRAGEQSAGPTPAALWIALIASFLLFSLGGAISGSTFLALIYDRAAEHQRGRAVGLVWTFLLLGFTIGGIFFSIMLPQDENAGAIAFSADSLLTLFIVTSVALTLIWFLSLLGEEMRRPGSAFSAAESPSSLRQDLSLVWRSRQMRFFLFYLTMSMAFAFLQDTVLEPFAAQIFGMGAHVTNRFAAYWGSMAILGSFATLLLLRRSAAFNHSSLSQAGVFVLMLGYLLFALSSLAEIRSLVTPGLILLGIGLGVWNIGTLGLMMDLSPAGRAGAFLGFWTFCVTLARGAGVAGGGIVRDLMLALSDAHTVAYGAVFCLGFLGLLAAWIALRQVRLDGANADGASDLDMAAALSHSMD